MVSMDRKAFWINTLGGLLAFLLGWFVFVDLVAYRFWPSEAYTQAERELEEYRRDYISWEQSQDRWEAELSRWKRSRNEWQRRRGELELWLVTHGPFIWQRQFEQTLAGVSPTSDIEDDQLRELAKAVILLLRSPGGGINPVEPIERVQALKFILSTNEQGYPLVRYYSAQVVVLNEPDRLV